jgi:hypothetical protein
MDKNGYSILRSNFLKTQVSKGFYFDLRKIFAEDFTILQQQYAIDPDQYSF